MNTRILGILGGLALVLALLSPYVLGSSKKVAELFEAAETLYDSDAYEAAIAKYEEVLKESNKLLARTETIDQDFKTLVNFKIAMSYVKLAEQSNDAKHYYKKALIHIERGVLTVTFVEYKENLTYLWGHTLYKIGHMVQAEEKFTELIKNFPNSRFIEKAQETVAQINKQLQQSEEKNSEEEEMEEAEEKDSKEEEMEEVVTPTDIIPIWVNDPSKFEAFNKKEITSLIVANKRRAEKQYVKAAEQYELFVNTNPSITGTAYALYWSGWCYYEAASDDETLLSKSCDAFQRLVNNYNDSAYSDKAREKLKKLENEKRKRDSHKAIVAADGEVHRAQQSECKSDLIPKAITGFGEAKRKHEQGSYIAALKQANEVINLANRAINTHKTAMEHVQQGYNYLRQERLETATKRAREAHRIDPSCQNDKKLLEEIKWKYFDQGVNYIETEEYAKAILPLKNAINIEPFKKGYYNLGIVHLNLGEFRKAIAAADNALAIDPNYEKARNLKESIDPMYR